MKRLYIYFSDTGNGDLIASYLNNKEIDVRKVTPKKNLPKSFFFKVFTGGFLASINSKTKLKDYDADVSAYDEIIIGSPVWNGKLSCPINTVLAKTDFLGKPVSFILYSGSGTAPKAIKFLQSKFSQSAITVLKEPKKYPEELEKIKL